MTDDANRETEFDVCAIQSAERERCAEDVCVYCGGRAPGWGQAIPTQNETGNWIHQKQGVQVLCKATPIWNRDAYEKAINE